MKNIFVILLFLASHSLAYSQRAFNQSFEQADHTEGWDLSYKNGEKFKDTKGIVIDIRNYPSEFMVFSLGKYLMPEPTEFVRFTNGSTQFPGLFEKTPAIKTGEKNRDYYKGKVVILINEISQSSAEYTTMAFRAAPNATVVGSTTAGADGNVSRFSLPGGLNTMISGIGIFYPDGKPTQRVGIIPDIEVKPTIAGIRAGKDELLDKALEIIRRP